MVNFDSDDRFCPLCQCFGQRSRPRPDFDDNVIWAYIAGINNFLQQVAVSDKVLTEFLFEFEIMFL